MSRRPTMRQLIPLFVVILSCIGLAPALAADAPKDDAAKLKESAETWEQLKKKCGGNYRYFVRTSSFSGFRTETEIVVRDNKVAGRRYMVTGGRPAIAVMPGGKPEQPAGPKYKWTERFDEVGTNKEGAPAKTIDELYAEAEKVIEHELQPHEKRYVRFDGQGLLKSCFYIDTRIMDDAPRTGVIISQIKLDEKPDAKK